MYLCGRPGCRCANIEITEYGYEITDEHGGKVKLTKEEFEMMRMFDL